MQTLIDEIWEELDKFGFSDLKSKKHYYAGKFKSDIVLAYNTATKMKYNKAAEMLGIDCQPFDINNGEDYYTKTYTNDTI